MSAAVDSGATPPGQLEEEMPPRLDPLSGSEFALSAEMVESGVYDTAEQAQQMVALIAAWHAILKEERVGRLWLIDAARSGALRMWKRTMQDLEDSNYVHHRCILQQRDLVGEETAARNKVVSLANKRRHGLYVQYEQSLQEVLYRGGCCLSERQARRRLDALERADRDAAAHHRMVGVEAICRTALCDAEQAERRFVQECLGPISFALAGIGASEAAARSAIDVAAFGGAFAHAAPKRLRVLRQLHEDFECNRDRLDDAMGYAHDTILAEEMTERLGCAMQCVRSLHVAVMVDTVILVEWSERLVLAAVKDNIAAYASVEPQEAAGRAAVRESEGAVRDGLATRFRASGAMLLSIVEGKAATLREEASDRAVLAASAEEHIASEVQRLAVAWTERHQGAALAHHEAFLLRLRREQAIAFAEEPLERWWLGSVRACFVDEVISRASVEHAWLANALGPHVAEAASLSLCSAEGFGRNAVVEASYHGCIAVLDAACVAWKALLEREEASGASKLRLVAVAHGLQQMELPFNEAFGRTTVDETFARDVVALHARFAAAAWLHPMRFRLLVSLEASRRVALTAVDEGTARGLRIDLPHREACGRSAIQQQSTDALADLVVSWYRQRVMDDEQRGALLLHAWHQRARTVLAPCEAAQISLRVSLLVHVGVDARCACILAEEARERAKAVRWASADREGVPLFELERRQRVQIAVQARNHWSDIQRLHESSIGLGWKQAALKDYLTGSTMPRRPPIEAPDLLAASPRRKYASSAVMPQRVAPHAASTVGRSHGMRTPTPPMEAAVSPSRRLVFGEG